MNSLILCSLHGLERKSLIASVKPCPWTSESASPSRRLQDERHIQASGLLSLSLSSSLENRMANPKALCGEWMIGATCQAEETQDMAGL